MSKRIRFLIMICILGIATAFIFSTLKWYIFLDESEKELAESSIEEIKEYSIEKALLDIEELKELFNQDSEALLPEKFLFLTSPVEELMKEKGEEVPAEWKINHIVSYLTPKQVEEKLQEKHKKEIEELKELREGIIMPGLDLKGGMKVTIQADFNAWAEMKGRQPSDDEKEALMQGALDTLMNRLDKFGLAEIVIRRQGVDTIVVELPGAADPERIRRVIIGKGRLSFHLVDVDAVGRFITYQATHPGPYLDEELNIIDPELKELIGEGLLLRKVYEKDEFGLDRHTDYTVIYETPGLEGEYIEDAGIRTDPITNDVYVTFRLSDEGGDIFYDFTNQNVNKILAVVLDDKVKMSARIKQAIRNDVQVEGTFTLDEARDLALILKTGALPVPLEIISQESEGASLGEDTIDRGIKAIIWGLIFVMAFMLLYYKGGGIIACLALSVNFFLLASILSVFNFTLTLTSIAGFILTVGMSVDANVIIFERIKEEYHLGKTRAASITAGFSKAFWTITDANVTTGIAAVILASFGKGPIQGFAVVLATGVVCSMITALFFSRLLFDFITDVFKPLRISMSWRSAQ